MGTLLITTNTNGVYLWVLDNPRINLIFTGKASEVYLLARCLMLNWGMHIMLFPQKWNTTTKVPKWVGMPQQTWHNWMGAFVCYCFCWELFTVSRRTPYVSCTLWKNYQVETRMWFNTKEKLVSVNILCEWNVSEISISANVVSTKWYHLGINAIFLQQKPGFI